MNKILIICIVVFVSYVTKAQVGIGTTTPSPNAALDITSTNKGLLLPRVADTNVVINPSAGLMIYDMNANSPAIHNGTNWRNLTTTTATQDSITYTVTGGTINNGFTNGTFKLLYAKQSIIGGASLAFDPVSFSKEADINSIAFIKGTINPPPGGVTIEIKFHKPGASTPYYSIKVVSVRANSYLVNNGAGQPFTEQIGISGFIYGYKNWINNLSFAWNTAINSEVPY